MTMQANGRTKHDAARLLRVRSRQGHDREGLCALGAGLRPGVRRGVRARPPCRDRGGRTRSAAASSRSASAPASRCRDYSRDRTDCAASIFPSRCCARRRSASTEFGLSNVEGLRVMDAEHLDISGCIVRRGGRAICRHDGAEPGSHARRIRPRVEAGRRDRPGQPRRRRSRPAARAGALVRSRRRASSAGGPSLPSSATRAGRRARRASTLVERRAMPPFGHFSLIRFAKDDAAAAARNTDPALRAAG